MKRALILGALLLTPMLLTAQAPAGGAAPAATGRGGGGGRGAGPQPPANLVSRGGGDCAEYNEQTQQWVVVQKWNCINEPNPLPRASTIWIEEMTWMDVRDALAAGMTTAIISTGGMEPNGPWLVTGKHNYVLDINCEAIARKLGNALCAPIVKFVPEGRIDPPSGHMNSAGTISLREDTYRAMLTDIATSLKVHGFKNIIFIGDSGGNQNGQAAVAAALTEQWKGNPVIAHIDEYYNSPPGTPNVLRGLGVVKDGQPSDELHDSPGITLNMLLSDPNSIRWYERVQAGLATINGVDISNLQQSMEWARQIVDARATRTVDVIRRSIAHGGTLPAAQTP
jgi:hypothetical protein